MGEKRIDSSGWGHDPYEEYLDEHGQMQVKQAGLTEEKIEENRGEPRFADPKKIPKGRGPKADGSLPLGEGTSPHGPH